MWTQSKAMDRQVGKEKFCHNQVWVQQMVLDIKDVLYKARGRLESITEPKELGQAISTILKSITLIENLDAGIADIEELRPDVKEVMKNFVDALKGKKSA
jgi:IS4 transposase